jgi:hypothetical protein
MKKSKGRLVNHGKKKIRVYADGQVDPQGLVSETLYRDTLNAVNFLRNQKGKKPLKKLPAGLVGQATECPVQNALNDCGVSEVQGSTIVIFDSKVTTTVETPFGTVPYESGRHHIDDEIELTPRTKGLSPAVRKSLVMIGKFVTAFDKNGEALDSY